MQHIRNDGLYVHGQVAVRVCDEDALSADFLYIVSSQLVSNSDKFQYNRYHGYRIVSYRIVSYCIVCDSGILTLRFFSFFLKKCNHDEHWEVKECTFKFVDRAQSVMG